MWSVGYIVAPTLFAMLEDRALAGAVAGQLFTIMSYLGLVAATVLLSAQLYYAEGVWHRNWRIWVLLTMLLLIVVGEFYLQPLMADLKSSGISKGSDNARRFGQLHGLASILFLINSLLGLGLIIFGLRRSTRTGG